MYNQLGIVSLDQPKSAYNHMELALPVANSVSLSGPGRSSGRGRQRRGDLKQVINVATLPDDSNHALLELDDVSIELSSHVHNLESGHDFSLPCCLSCLVRTTLGIDCPLHRHRPQRRPPHSPCSDHGIIWGSSHARRLLVPNPMLGKPRWDYGGSTQHVQPKHPGWTALGSCSSIPSSRFAICRSSCTQVPLHGGSTRRCQKEKEVQKASANG